MEVKARLSHASIKTALDRYGHLLPTLGGRLDAALDQAHRAAKSNVSRPVRGLEVVEIETAEDLNAS